ncbi:putative alpha-xylosidase [Phlyctema vagabunda]|uniref:alpha-glucosidase n=1 Tax=Phlyctema vagabunda TaxID=108571 RepID=A0ABR4P538_9HELO
MKDYTFPSQPRAHTEATVTGPQYRFSILSDRLLRYEWAEDGIFEDRASTFAINREFPVPDFHTIDNEDSLEIVTKYFHVSYDKKKFSTNGLIVGFNAKLTDWGAPWRYGSRASNLGGTARTLDEADGRIDMGDGILSREGFAAVDDSNSMLFDGQGFVAGRKHGDRVDGYLFTYGIEYKAAIKALYALSGKQPVLPRWALGNWWSRYYRYTQDEYIGLMDQFKERKIPLSVAVIDMDWHLVKDDRVPHAGWTGYTFDDEVFPDPEAFGRELHKRNLKITLNDHPHAGIHHHEDSYLEMAKAVNHDISKKTPILFDPTSPKFMEAYLTILHRNVEKVACDFWWIDWQQGPYSKVPGLDPLWLLNHFHFLDNGRVGDKRPLIFSRYAGPGSHRYPVGFSGDTVISWASLEFQPEFTATASNIGYGWWSHDIGGHMMGARDDELVTRWVQYGVFSPLMRLHSSSSPWMSKEPWMYKSEHQAVMESILKFRHRLIPYIYTMNVTRAADDEPFIQPIYWEHPDRDEAYSVPNEYFFGSELIVSPIVKPRDLRTGLASVKTWFPPSGRHVDIFTGTVYDGDRHLNVYRPLETIPVFAHEGSIIPLDSNTEPQNGCLNPDIYEILVVVGKDGSISVIEDAIDDIEISAGDKQRKSDLEYNQENGKITARVAGGQWKFRLLSITEVPKEFKVLINDNDVTKNADTSVSNYPDTPSLVVSCPASENGAYTIVVELGKTPQLGILDHSTKMQKMLLEYQITISTKDAIWNVINDHKSSINVKIGKLMSLDLDEALTGPFAELILSDSRTLGLWYVKSIFMKRT